MYKKTLEGRKGIGLATAVGLCLKWNRNILNANLPKGLKGVSSRFEFQKTVFTFVIYDTVPGLWALCWEGCQAFTKNFLTVL